MTIKGRGGGSGRGGERLRGWRKRKMKWRSRCEKGDSFLNKVPEVFSEFHHRKKPKTGFIKGVSGGRKKGETL